MVWQSRQKLDSWMDGYCVYVSSFCFDGSKQCIIGQMVVLSCVLMVGVIQDFIDCVEVDVGVDYEGSC